MDYEADLVQLKVVNTLMKKMVNKGVVFSVNQELLLVLLQIKLTKDVLEELNEIKRIKSNREKVCKCKMIRCHLFKNKKKIVKMFHKLIIQMHL